VGRVLEISSAGDVTVVTMNHGKVSALDLELCAALTSAFRDFTSGPVVLTGTGGVFSAGVNLWNVVEGGPGYIRRFLPALVEAFEAVFTCPVPVVAAINGHAIAGGCVLAAACDHRIMTTSPAGIGVPELLVGVPFPSPALEIVEYVIGPRKARQAVVTGELYQPDRALAIGLVDELADPETLAAQAIAHASRIGASVPLDTFRVTKREWTSRVARSRDLNEVTRLWEARVADGWIGAYLARTVRR
jgi:enoyl-CoA hydratase/carnithine racemase